LPSGIPPWSPAPGRGHLGWIFEALRGRPGLAPDLLGERQGFRLRFEETIMTRKPSKTDGKRRRPAVKDLTADKRAAVRGGKVNHSEFVIIKTSDKASSNLMSS
jgi:hypothetical protein